jgi:hypothetical protein
MDIWSGMADGFSLHGGRRGVPGKLDDVPWRSVIAEDLAPVLLQKAEALGMRPSRVVERFVRPRDESDQSNSADYRTLIEWSWDGFRAEAMKFACVEAFAEFHRLPLAAMPAILAEIERSLAACWSKADTRAND